MLSNFESIIPNINISKITLESSAKNNFADNDPHIDSLREPGTYRDPISGRLLHQVITADILKKDISSDQLYIKVYLSIKETIGNDGIDSFFTKDIILRYLKANIISVFDLDIYNIIISKNLKPSQFFDTANFPGIESKQLATSKKQSIALKDIIGKSELNQLEFTLDNDGNKVYDISFYIEFRNNNSTPQHLSLFTSVYLDVEQMIKDYQMSFNPEQISTLLESPVFYETIIDNFNVVGENVQDFRDIKEIQKLMLDFSIIENEVSILNNKLKILSNDKLIPEIKKNYFSDFLISRDSEGNARFFFSIDYLKLIKENTRFGSLYKDKNADLLQNVRIRIFKIFRIRINNDKDILKDDMGIALFNELDAPELICISSEQEAGKFIKTKYKSSGIIQEVKIFSYSVVSNFSSVGAVGFRHFSGIDLEVKNLTDGQYKYFVELEIEDNTSNFIFQKVGDLLNSYNLLKQYYIEALNPNNFDSLSGRLKNSFVNDMENRYKDNVVSSPWITPVTVYLSILAYFVDINNNIFAKSLFSFIHPRTGNPDGMLSVLNLMDELINKLSRVIDVTIMDKSFIKSSGQLVSSLQKSKNPVNTFKIYGVSGEIFDCDVVKNVGYDFLSNGDIKIEDNIDGIKQIKNLEYNQRTDLETLKYFKSSDTDIVMSSKIKGEYNSGDTLGNTKYSYLTPSNVRLGNDNKFIFINQGEGLFDSQRYSVLMSSVMDFNLNKITISKRFLGSDSGNKLNFSDWQTKKSLENVFADNNLVVKSPTLISLEERNLNVKDVLGLTTNALKEDITIDKKSKDTLSNDGNNVVNVNVNNLLLSIGLSLILKGMSDTDFIQDGQKEEKFLNSISLTSFDLNDPNNIIDKESLQDYRNILFESETRFKESELKDIRARYLKGLPNQLKSLFLNSVSANKVIKNWFKEGNKDIFKNLLQYLVYLINYNMIGAIEVLSGYYDAKRPIWDTLSSNLFSKSQNEILLCRTRFYENKDIGIKFPKGLELPIFNQYFFLIPNSTNETINQETFFVNQNMMDMRDFLVNLNNQQGPKQ